MYFCGLLDIDGRVPLEETGEVRCALLSDVTHQGHRDQGNFTIRLGLNWLAEITVTAIRLQVRKVCRMSSIICTFTAFAVRPQISSSRRAKLGRAARGRMVVWRLALRRCPISGSDPVHPAPSNPVHSCPRAQLNSHVSRLSSWLKALSGIASHDHISLERPNQRFSISA